MTRRRAILFGSIVTVAVATGLGVWYWMETAASRVRFAHLFPQLKLGQSREDVHRVMERPPGHYTHEGYALPRDLSLAMLNPKKSKFESWSGDDGIIYVRFAGDRLVEAWLIHPLQGDSTVFNPHTERLRP